MRFRLLHAFVFSAVLLGGATAPAYNETNQSYFPILKPPTSLLVAKTWSDGTTPPIALSSDANAARAQFILLESLAGLLLKHGEKTGVFIEANANHRLLLHDLAQRRGLSYSYVSAPATVWTIVDQFAAKFGTGYVRCNIGSNPDSLNVARMAAYKYDAVIVDAAIEPVAQARRMNIRFDASDKDDQWFRTNWWPEWPIKDLAVEQNNNPALLGDLGCLNDYAAATGVPVFFDGAATALRSAFLSELELDSVLVGWPLFDELEFTTLNSQNNVSLAAANWCFDLALLSSFRDPGKLPLKQATCPGVQPLETNVHYVSFVFTDGDNVQWMHNGFLVNTQWWASPHRGQIPVGWGISPTLRDLSPTVLERLYADAAGRRPANDVFCAMSPIGYCYPALMSAQARATNAARLNRYLQDIGSDILIVLDKSGFETPSVYEAYFRQPALNAIFYWDAFGDYAKYAGAVRWTGRKPLISAFTSLWGANGPAQVADKLKQRSKNPSSTDGYSLVAVHAWSHGVDSIRQCMQLLGPDMRVVTPDVLVALMQRYASPSTKAAIDSGSWQAAPYMPSSAAVSVFTNQVTPSTDGSPSTRFSVSANYGFCNLNFPSPIAVSALDHTLDFDLHGDSSRSMIRLELWSSQFQAFLYKDLPLDFSGWRHYSYRLDCTDGLQVWNGTPDQVSSAITIWQVSGSWNNTPASFSLDNVQVVRSGGLSRSEAPVMKADLSGSLLRLSWPGEFDDYRAETLPDLTSPPTLIKSMVFRTNCECFTVVQMTNAMGFFRLVGP